MDDRPAQLDTAPPLDLEVRVEGAHAVLVLSGEFDLAGELCAWRALHAAMAGPASAIVLDLRELVFMDLTGARWLRRAHRAAVHVGKPVTVLPSDAVCRMLELCPP